MQSDGIYVCVGIVGFLHVATDSTSGDYPACTRDTL